MSLDCIGVACFSCDDVFRVSVCACVVDSFQMSSDICFGYFMCSSMVPLTTAAATISLRRSARKPKCRQSDMMGDLITCVSVNK